MALVLEDSYSDGKFRHCIILGTWCVINKAREWEKLEGRLILKSHVCLNNSNNSNNQAIAVQSIYPREMKTYVHTKTFT
jgi:hypothetical protein